MLTNRLRIFFCILAAIGLLGISIPGAHATTSLSVEQQFETTFQEMLKHPDNVDVTLRYADLAIQLKDYEAAIPALERILLFNPGLSKIKLELGKLYFLLGSYDVAKTYFIDAQKAKDVTPDIYQRADEFLAKIKA